MKYLFAFTIFIALAYQATAQSCHLREVDLCVATMIFHYQGSGVPVDESGVESLCESIDETTQCLRNFTNKCMTPVQREVLQLIAEGSEATVKDFCTPGSEVRVKFLKHAKSLKPNSTKSGTLCCGFRKFLECGEKLTEQKCGREAVEMGRTIAELAVTELPNVVCHSFDPNSSSCQALLPPKGSTPKGTQSGSQLARLLATALGN
ncbi:hypothetical protein HNY73_020584 [Argiope bruennichi]|uniref:Uncharacterized protein n=1 Tax=Argiope bruennichi TaxID=94029 RepID=A0A8T0E9W2_ARGBR|nr:hypothetical protein HNY73_020584 [Argiope bruennichi]